MESDTPHPLGRPWLAGLALWLGALAALAPFDLAISRSAARPEHWFGRLIQDHGTHPALVLYVALVAWLAIPSLRRRSRLISRCASAVLIQALLHTLAITTALKHLWGRARFADLAPDGPAFAPLWVPELLGGGLSFPSGHVATAFVLAPAVVLLARAGRSRAALILGAMVVAFGLTVAAGRIVFGAHYATDSVFSMGLAWLVAPLSIALGDRYLALFERRERAAEGGGRCADGRPRKCGPRPGWPA
jgi:membrane-associated phospholipid phosphatase